MLELRLVLLALDGLALNLQLLQAARNLVEFLGHAVALHAQLGSRLVHQVDGLVGQEALGDVAVREFHGSHHGLVLDTHLVVCLVSLLQPSQDGDARCHVGLVDHHALEPAFERLVLLEVLLVLIEGCSAYAAQVATCQSGLQDVGGVHGALASSGTHQRVDFVDEEDDLAVGLDDVVDDALQTFLELTLVLCASHQRAHVEAVDLLAAQILRHVAAHDALCQPLHDGCLARAGLADEDGVVLRPAGEDLQDASDFLVTSDDGVELSVLCRLVQVDAEAVEERVLLVGIDVVVVHSVILFFSCSLFQICLVSVASCFQLLLI